MRKTYLAVAAALLAFGMVQPALAQNVSDTDASLDKLFGEHASYHQFFDDLRKAIGANDKHAVAAMVDYPFKTKINGKPTTVKSAAGFIVSYDKIVTVDVKDAVVQQTYPALFANWQGVMIGKGNVWFSGLVGKDKKTRIKIIGINH
ncbi:hypothetical protein HGP17_28015 [Rhizobium sp. P38BS-XIX]|uniref:hypothetical protein n=1 Tax=Rhizobium sp. P38BS-XIX TaxID=2726740 RepID=UPI0014572458|nr:hypothetical protein [Rhizobium sp. P38BS-XIX]NLS00693.1 hypothetical protein [Rhizobium sp. P38BS-XIX]